MCVKYIPIQCRIATFQTYRVLTDVTPCIRVVIPEPIVIQSRLCIFILPLVLERNERGWPFPLPPVDVQLLFPHLVALLVVGLQGRAEVVGDDGVALAVVVVEVFAVFGQPATGIVAAVVAFARLEEVAHAVGHAVEAFHLSMSHKSTKSINFLSLALFLLLL